MKIKKMAKELQEILDADSGKRKKQRKNMKSLLRKMRLKEMKLASKALTEFDEKKLVKLHKEIYMLHAQRKKGVDALKELQKKKKSKP